MNRLVNVLILLAGATYIIGMAIGLGRMVPVFAPGTFWKFSVGCLAFAVTLLLLQIRDKK